MSDYRKFLLANTFNYFFVRWAIATLYLMSQGMEVSQAIRLMSYYSIANVVLEFPTWVVGDYFGHKKSVVLWSVFYGISFFVMCIDMPRWWYILPFTICALWSSLVSWSDIWLMKSIIGAEEFKSKYPWYKSYTLIIVFLASITSWYMFNIWTKIPLIITWICSISAAIVFSTIKFKHIPDKNTEPGNIFATAKLWLKSVFTSPSLIILLITYAIANGYIRSTKTLTNSLFEFFDVDVIWLTYGIWLVFLAQAAWAYSSKRLSEKYIYTVPVIISIITIVMWILTYTITDTDWFYILIYFTICGFLVAIINALITMYVSDAVPQSVLAWTLSLYGLCTRLFLSIYLFVSWYILWRYNISTLFLLTAIVFTWIWLANVCYSLFVYYNKQLR